MTHDLNGLSKAQLHYGARVPPWQIRLLVGVGIKSRNLGAKGECGDRGDDQKLRNRTRRAICTEWADWTWC